MCRRLPFGQTDHDIALEQAGAARARRVPAAPGALVRHAFERVDGRDRAGLKRLVYNPPATLFLLDASAYAEVSEAA